MQDQVHSWQPKDDWIDKYEIKNYLCDYSDIIKMQTDIKLIMSILEHEDKTDVHFTDYRDAKLVYLIWRGNSLETGMGNNESATQIHIKNTVNNYATNYPTLTNTSESLARLHSRVSWNAEGIQTSSTLQQQEGWKIMGDQAVLAYKWLNMNILLPLTVQDIKNVHQILMSGAMDDCGCFRTDSAMAGNYEFNHYTDIETRLTEMVCRFNLSVKDVNIYPITVAIQLMLDFVTIHPFRNGNGRMCRLLFSYALQKMGFPFPVPLDSGHSKTYKHYIKALKMAQGHCKKGALLQLGIISVHAILINYAKYSNNPNLKEFCV